MKIAKFIASAAILALSVSVSFAQALEKKSISLGVGGKPLLYYLPLTLAERLGYFKEAGLDVQINDFGGGAKSLQALVGGSLDVVTGAYEHTIRMQAKGQDIRAVIVLGRYPGIVLAVRKDTAANFKSIADLKGMNIGITAPGSSTHSLVQYLMIKNGLNPHDASFIGVGSGASAVAAIQNKQVDAISHLDPVITKLEQTGDIKIIVDTRTTRGTMDVFGATNPAAVLYMKKDFIDKNPKTVQALVNVFKKTLTWLSKATPEQIAEVVPHEYWLGDKALYIKALTNSRESYSIDGTMSKKDMETSLDLIVKTDPNFKASSVKLENTFDDHFLKAAPKSGTLCRSGDRRHKTTFGAQCRTVGGRGFARSDIDHHIGDLLHAGKTLDQRRRPVLLDKVRRRRLDRLAILLGEIRHESFDTLRHRRPRQHRIHRHGSTLGQLGQTARDRQLRGLGHAVVDHLFRNHDRGFGGDENDAAPVLLEHARHIGPRQPDARHHVDVEEAVPIFIGNVEERLRLENAGVVDENIDLRHGLHERGAAFGCRDIGRDPAYLRRRRDLSDGCNGLIDLGLSPAVDDDIRPRPCKPLGDGVADAAGRTGDERGGAGQIDVHTCLLWVATDMAIIR